MSIFDRVVNATFMSATARTAGFNTVNYGATADSTNFLTILLMSVGGSPGSTAGGLKTTTFAVLGLTAYARFRGRHTTSLLGRSIPDETVQRAIGLFVVGFIAVTTGILLFAIVELPPVGTGSSSGFLGYMFEAVSAFNTVGLSMGATGRGDRVREGPHDPPDVHGQGGSADRGGGHLAAARRGGRGVQVRLRGRDHRMRGAAR